MKNRVAWTLPSFEDELGEFNRYDLSREEVAAIRDQFSQSNMVKLTEDIWSRLNNTDSYDVRDEDKDNRKDERRRDTCRTFARIEDDAQVAKSRTTKRGARTQDED